MQRPCPCSSKISIFSSFWACIAYFLLQFILVIFFQLFACHKHCWGRVCMFALRQFLPQTWEKWWKSSRNWWGHCSFHNKSKIKGLTKLNHRHLLSCNRAFCLFSFFFVFEDILFTELSCYFSISSCMKKQWFWHVCKLLLLYSKDVQELCCISCSPKRGVQLVYK